MERILDFPLSIVESIAARSGSAATCRRRVRATSRAGEKAAMRRGTSKFSRRARDARRGGGVSREVAEFCRAAAAGGSL